MFDLLGMDDIAEVVAVIRLGDGLARARVRYCVGRSKPLITDKGPKAMS